MPIGQGIKPHAFLPSGEKSKRHEEALKRWADTTECDAEGRTNLYGLQALAVRHLVRDGEALIQKIITRDSVPLRLRVLSCDHIDSAKSNQNTSDGIERKKDGSISAYWIFPSLRNDHNPKIHPYSCFRYHPYIPLRYNWSDSGSSLDGTGSCSPSRS